VCLWGGFRSLVHSSLTHSYLHCIPSIYTATSWRLSYSGMHDDGPSPALQEGGVMSQLIARSPESQQSSDEHLTGVG
jgi:hypothetical protein